MFSIGGRGAMRRPGGYAIICDPCAPVVEMDTFTCGHCCLITHVRQGERAEDLGGLCRGCMQLVCSVCVDESGCTPIEKRLEVEEARYHALRSYGMV